MGAVPLNSNYMSDELDNGTQDPTLEQDTTETVETANSEAENAELRAKIAELEGQNKQLYARIKKEKPKETLPTNQQSPNPEEIERLRLEVKGYNGDEVEFLMQNGGLKALDNKIAMAGIEALRKAQKSLDATPTETGRSTVFQKYTERDLKKMSLEELEKIVPQED